MRRTKDSSRKMRVLVAEEDAAASRLLSKVLTLFGCETMEATSYQQAIAHALRSAPDVVISSMHLGGYTAKDVATQIRSLEIESGPSFIALRAPGEAYEISMYAIFRHVVEKPADLLVLGEILARCDPFM